MPRTGTLDTAAALADAPHVLSTSGPSWDIADATLVQVNWEVDDAAALELTPPACHPSIPPFASFFAGRYPDTPVGTFNLAQARIVIRAGIRPRAFCLGRGVRQRRGHGSAAQQLGLPGRARRGRGVGPPRPHPRRRRGRRAGDPGDRAAAGRRRSAATT